MIDVMEQAMQPSMDSPGSRDTLRRTLATRGIEARESYLGGIRALEVVLVPDDGYEALSILAYSMDTPCEVGLSGYRMDGERQIDCASAETLRPETQEQAAAAAVVQSFWVGRDAFIRDYRSGRYDLI